MWRLRGEDSLDSEPVGRGHEGQGPVGEARVEQGRAPGELGRGWGW